MRSGERVRDLRKAKSLSQRALGDLVGVSFAKRHCSKIDKVIEVLFLRAATRAYKLYKQITEGQDAPEVKSAVDQYHSALLMPAWLIRDASEQVDFLQWPDLYRLAELAQVTMSNLTVRLQRFGLICLRDGDRQIYRSKDEFTGQGSLFDTVEEHH